MSEAAVDGRGELIREAREKVDAARMAAIEPLLTALDPRHVRLPAIEQKLGAGARSRVREVAFGAGPEPTDFVVVLGLQPQAETGLPPAQAVCAALELDGLHPEASGGGCRLGKGAIVAQTEDGHLVVASKESLVKDLLGTPDLGDRLGFSGPSVRGVAPEVGELSRESSQLAQRVLALYP